MKIKTACLSIFVMSLFITSNLLAERTDTVLANRINAEWNTYQNFSRGNPCAWKENSKLVSELNNFTSEIINTVGFPEVQAVGETASQYFGFIMSLPVIKPLIMKKALEAMKKSVDKHTADASTYARLFDMSQYQIDGRQFYGTIVNLTCSNCKTEQERFTSPPIISPEKVDDRRKAMGLEPLTDYLSKIKTTFVYIRPDDIKSVNPCAIKK